MDFRTRLVVGHFFSVFKVERHTFKFRRIQKGFNSDKSFCLTLFIDLIFISIALILGPNNLFFKIFRGL